MDFRNLLGRDNLLGKDLADLAVWMTSLPCWLAEVPDATSISSFLPQILPLRPRWPGAFPI
jgi:hypothetical protein